MEKNKTETTKKPKPKSWKKMGYFNTYNEAQTRKSQLHSEHTVDNNLLIKINRCGPGGSRFVVKMWHPDFVTTNKDKKQTKSKKKK